MAKSRNIIANGGLLHEYETVDRTALHDHEPPGPSMRAPHACVCRLRRVDLNEKKGRGPLACSLLHKYMGQIATKNVIFDGISTARLSPHSSTVEAVLYVRHTLKGPLCAANT